MPPFTGYWQRFSNCSSRQASSRIQLSTGSFGLSCSKWLANNISDPAQANLCLQRVKLRRTRCEQMSSGLHLKADVAQCSRHVSKVPGTEVKRRSLTAV